MQNREILPKTFTPPPHHDVKQIPTVTTSKNKKYLSNTKLRTYICTSTDIQYLGFQRIIFGSWSTIAKTNLKFSSLTTNIQRLSLPEDSLLTPNRDLNTNNSLFPAEHPVQKHSLPPPPKSRGNLANRLAHFSILRALHSSFPDRENRHIPPRLLRHLWKTLLISKLTGFRLHF